MRSAISANSRRYFLYRSAADKSRKSASRRSFLITSCSSRRRHSPSHSPQRSHKEVRSAYRIERHSQGSSAWMKKGDGVPVTRELTLLNVCPHRAKDLLNSFPSGVR